MSPFLTELLQHDRFVLTTHLRGDGDAVGSTLAMSRFLQKAGKTAHIISPDRVSSNLDWMPGIDEIESYSGSLAQRERIHGADALVVMDTNSAARIGDLADSFLHAQATRVLIDHHPDPEGWFDLVYQRDSASSTGELVSELIGLYEVARNATVLDHDIATQLYTAIMTDTGSFRFSSVNAAVHRHVADLIERGGIVPEDIHIALYDNRTLTSLRLLGKALERISLRYGDQLGFIPISRQFMTDAGGERGDTEGLVNYILSIEGVKVAVLFLETEKGTKLSFRSQGDVAVNSWAAAFKGGGHRNAAGAFVRGYLDEVVEKVLSVAPKYIPCLQSARDGLHDRPEDEASGDLSEADAAYLTALLNTKSR